MQSARWIDHHANRSRSRRNRLVFPVRRHSRDWRTALICRSVNLTAADITKLAECGLTDILGKIGTELVAAIPIWAIRFIALATAWWFLRAIVTKAGGT